MTKTLMEEMGPLDMVEALKGLQGTDGLHEHGLKELLLGALEMIEVDCDPMPFWSGRYEASTMQTIAMRVHELLSDIMDIWKIAVLTQYQEAMWPKTMEEAMGEVVQLFTEGQHQEAIAKVQAFKNLTRQDLDNMEIGRTIIPERIPVSWGYL